MPGHPVVAVLATPWGGDGEGGGEAVSVDALEVGEVLGSGVVVGDLGDVEVDHDQAAGAGGDADAVAAVRPGGSDAGGVGSGPLFPAGVTVNAAAVGVVAQVGGVVGPFPDDCAPSRPPANRLTWRTPATTALDGLPTTA